ncbi:MAG: C25 family cysteine peptidase, partial [bacterium]
MFRSNAQNTPARLLPFLLVAASLLTSGACAETLTYNLTAAEYNILPVTGGQKIVMAGFGQLAEPGKPLLPARKFLIALPPGARVRSVEVIGLDAEELAGAYAIAPAPPVLPLSGSVGGGDRVEEARREWRENNSLVYGADQAYPSRVGWFEGSGSLRQYAYVAVTFCPFTYHPLSGRLIHHATARVEIDYTLPAPGSPDAESVAMNNQDRAAAERARRLFVNFRDVEMSYQPDPTYREPAKDSYDYVIITPESLYPVVAASDFIPWKESLGHEVVVVLITGAKISRAPGRDLSEQIRNFLRDEYLNWGTEYVLLVGDYLDVPMRYCYPEPGNHLNEAGNPNSYSGEVPTDHYFADLSLPDSLSWDLDRDGYHGEWGEDNPDLLADVFVGRIPTSDPTRITYTLNKLVRFEQDTGNWKNRALHGAAIAFFENEDYSGYAFKDLATFIDLVETDFLGGWTVSRYSEQGGLVTSPYPWQPLTPTVFVDDWRSGQYGLVNWGGHGWSHGAHGKTWDWDDGDGVAESYAPQEISHYQFVGSASNLEDDYPSIVFSLSCLVGYPEPNAWDNLGVDILTEPGFGAAAGIASGSRVVWVSQGGGELLCYEFNHFLIAGPEGSEKVGEALFDAKYEVYLANSHLHHAEFWNTFCYNLYGDPALAREGATPLTQVEASPPVTPSDRLLSSYPNPFNPRTTIRFSLARQQPVRLAIFAVDGRKVLDLLTEVCPAGLNEVVWDGR